MPLKPDPVQNHSSAETKEKRRGCHMQRPAQISAGMPAGG
jgi:hypothetical protein